MLFHPCVLRAPNPAWHVVGIYQMAYGRGASPLCRWHGHQKKDTTLHWLSFHLYSLLPSLLLGFFKRRTLSLILFRDMSWFFSSFCNSLPLFSGYDSQISINFICLRIKSLPDIYLHSSLIHPKLHISLPPKYIPASLPSNIIIRAFFLTQLTFASVPFICYIHFNSPGRLPWFLKPGLDVPSILLP